MLSSKKPCQGASPGWLRRVKLLSSKAGVYLIGANHIQAVQSTVMENEVEECRLSNCNLQVHVSRLRG